MAATTPGRVVISRNTEELLDLAGRVYARHHKDRKASELGSLDGYSWDTVGPTIQKTVELHKRAEALKGELESLYRERDALFNPINEITRASAQFLKAKYRKTPKKLAEWGYEIDDTPRKRAPKKG